MPRSQAQFLARLRTFADVRQWTSKPEAVGEVEWAKRGWLCVGVNMVACKGGCEKRVVVGLRAVAKDEEGVEVEGSEDFSVDVGESEYTVPVQEFPLTTSPADDELVRRYVDIIVTGHEESCLWRGAGCGGKLYCYFTYSLAKSCFQTTYTDSRLHNHQSGSHSCVTVTGRSYHWPKTYRHPTA